MQSCWGGCGRPGGEIGEVTRDGGGVDNLGNGIGICRGGGEEFKGVGGGGLLTG